jgi:hypothetical protein
MLTVLTVCLNVLVRESVTALPETANASLVMRVRHVPVVCAPMIALEMEFAYPLLALRLMLDIPTTMLGILRNISDVNVMLDSVDLTALFRSVHLTTILCTDAVVESVTKEPPMMIVTLVLIRTIVTVLLMSSVIAPDVVSVTTNLVSASASPDSSVRLARSRPS